MTDTQFDKLMRELRVIGTIVGIIAITLIWRTVL